MKIKILFLISGWCMILPSQTVSAEDAMLWKRWLITQVEQHPSILAAQETLNTAQSSAEGRIAGIELEQEWKLTFIDYLTQSGLIAVENELKTKDGGSQ